MKIGTDILEVARIDKLVKNETFAQKTFFAEELEYANQTSNPSMHLTGFFCAKESVVKALEGGTIHEIKILHKPNGSPYVELFGITKKLANDRQVEISISHTEDTAIASCVVF